LSASEHPNYSANFDERMDITIRDPEMRTIMLQIYCDYYRGMAFNTLRGWNNVLRGWKKEGLRFKRFTDSCSEQRFSSHF
jgi:hypothetical protein